MAFTHTADPCWRILDLCKEDHWGGPGIALLNTGQNLNIYLLMKYKNTLRYLMSLEKLFIKRDCTPSLMKPATALTRRVSRILLLLQCLLVWRLTGSSVWPVILPWLAVVPIFRDRGRVQWNKLWETYSVNLYKYSTMDTM